MSSTLRTTAALLLTVFLVQCSWMSSEEKEYPAVNGARDSIVWTLQIVEGSIQLGLLRPSALLGAYAAQYLLHTSAFRGALDGIEAAMSILLDEQASQSPSFAMLQDLGVILQVNIPDMLNRSTDRPHTFDAYMDGLRDMLETSLRQLEALEQQLDAINTERRDARRAVADIQSDLRTALREQDYASASSMQEQLINAEGELATVQARADETESIIRLFENLTEVGEERYIAMNANREALLAGITVTDLPGIDDLGVLMEGRRSRNRGSIFDLSGI